LIAITPVDRDRGVPLQLGWRQHDRADLTSLPHFRAAPLRGQARTSMQVAQYKKLA